MAIGVVPVVTAAVRIQPRAPFGRIGSSTCNQSLPCVPVTRKARAESSDVREEK